MPKSASDKRKSAAHRLAIIEGHVRKVRRMVDQGEFCIDIIHQSRAVQQALKKFDEQMLDHHLRTCVRRDLQASRLTNDGAVDELLEVFQRL